MNDSAKDQVQGKLHQSKGAAKEAMGELTDNPKLKAEVGGAWDAIARAQAVFRLIETEFDVIEGGRAFNTRYKKRSVNALDFIKAPYSRANF